MRNRFDTDTEDSQSAPADLVRAVSIDLKHPAGREVAKKITQVPNPGEVEVHNVFLRIEIAANQERLAAISILRPK